MSSPESKLDRLGTWFERQNALHDEILKGRPLWWHAGKVAFGLIVVVRSVKLAMDVESVGGYALAGVFLVCGVALAFEGAKMLHERWLARRGA